MSMVVAMLVLAAQSLIVTTIAQGTDSGITEPRQIVVRSSSEWEALWKAHGRGAIPAVDFTQSMVMGVFAGSRPTAGFRITIESIVSDGPVITVQYHEERPSPDDLVAQILTAPFHLVVIPRRDGAVEFQSR